MSKADGGASPASTTRGRLSRSVAQILARGSSDQPDLFSRFASWTSRAAGGRWAFLGAFGVVLIWAVCGPIFNYSEDWQLVINTGTTIVTFLMVFLIQNSQNRDSRAIQLKLDELILAVRQADNQLVDVESLTEQQLDAIHERYRMLASRYHERLEEQVEDMSEEVRSVSERVDEVEDEVEGLDRNLDALDEKVDRLNGKEKSGSSGSRG